MTRLQVWGEGESDELGQAVALAQPRTQWPLPGPACTAAHEGGSVSSCVQQHIKVGCELLCPAAHEGGV